MRLATLAGLFLVSVSYAHAWIETGHMVVAAVAEKSLSPKARAKVAELLRIGTDEKTNTFVTCSVWADDHKSDKDRAWHYINLHFRKDGKPVTNTPPAENVVWAIEQQSKILANPKSSKEDQAAALRYLVHFVGDVHQPLHGVALDSGEFPEGDRGGNDFKIKPVEGFSQRPLGNLHVLWDFACGEYPGVDRPLSAAGKAKIDRYRDELLTTYPRKKLAGVAEPNPMKWARESHDLAKSAAYDLTPNTEVPKEYLRKGREICRKRVAMAGYRLADLLNRLIG